MADYDRTCRAAEELIDLIEEELPDGLYVKAEEFFDGILERTKSIWDTIERTGRASDAQAGAIANMRAGVDRWWHG